MHKYNGYYRWSHFPHENKSTLEKGNATGTIFIYADKEGAAHELQMISYNGPCASLVEEYYADKDHGRLYFDFDSKTVRT